jgi:glycosyltransferase involved in cell wall biosynthesis
MQLSIVIPAYNEARRIGAMLDPYTSYFGTKYGDQVELIVAVNGSRDATESIARDYEERYPQVRVVVDQRPIGKGGAIMMGAEAARGDLIGFVDADGATPPEAFDALVEHLGDAGAIFASRWLPGAQVEPRQPLKRRIASRIFNQLVKLLFKVQITDTQCGAKLMRAEAMRAILPKLGCTRWAFDVDLLFQLRRAGYRIVEWPTVWRDVAGSKINIPKASLEMFVAIVRLRMLYSPLAWVVRLYNRFFKHYHIDRPR